MRRKFSPMRRWAMKVVSTVMSELSVTCKMPIVDGDAQRYRGSGEEEVGGVGGALGDGDMHHLPDGRLFHRRIDRASNT